MSLPKFSNSRGMKEKHCHFLSRNKKILEIVTKGLSLFTTRVMGIKHDLFDRALCTSVESGIYKDKTYTHTKDFTFTLNQEIPLLTAGTHKVFLSSLLPVRSNVRS